MADCVTHFSCVLDVGTPEHAARAIEIFEERPSRRADGNFDIFTSFSVSVPDGPQSSVLWIHEEDSGDVESVVAFVLRLAEEFDLTGLWGFGHANTCSRPRLDAFGGGAHILDLAARKCVGWIGTQEWLTVALHGETDPAQLALRQI